ncbi:MAG: hypothetical protein J4G06_01490 [Caldilineaceae bacterium]|nr:hypothetical protein [Caldilineaceae bacterium]
MIGEPRSLLEGCIDRLARGDLQEGHLREVLAHLPRAAAVQDLLYLQCSTTSVTSQVLGVQLVANGEVQPEPDRVADFPYQSVLEAMRDGWRVLQFPNMALLLDEERTYGLGCEFILERCSKPNPEGGGTE